MAPQVVNHQLMRPAIVIPAFNAADTVEHVVRGLRAEVGADVPIWVVDDGSTDATSARGRNGGARVLRHAMNRGKGAAIRTGLSAARENGCDVAQSPSTPTGSTRPSTRHVLLDCELPSGALVLGTRDLARAGAPRGNLIGNRASNFFVSLVTRRRFRDTQCGLRRYPIEKTFAVRTNDQRFGFEAEIIFALLRAGCPSSKPRSSSLPAEEQAHHPLPRLQRHGSHRLAHHGHGVFPDPLACGRRWLLPSCSPRAFGHRLHDAHDAAPVVVPLATPPAPTQVIPIFAGWAPTTRATAERSGRCRSRARPRRSARTRWLCLRAEMVANEAELWSQFENVIPSAFARFLIFDIARVRFRNIDRLISDRHRREIAAAASAFAPDPWAERIPSYQRMVYLHSLYDVSLSFEHSPLIGCTSFALTGDAAEAGHSVLARNFDFEAGDIFDEHKAVFLVARGGKLAYASVAWPGLIGAVTGMNEAGLALVVHGGRAASRGSSASRSCTRCATCWVEARSTDDAIATLSRASPW